MKDRFPFIYKLGGIIIAAFMVGLVLSSAFSADAASVAGSVDDPLVSKSWVDAYIEAQFAPISDKIAALKENIGCHIQLFIGSKTAYVNGSAVQMDTTAQIMGAGYTMVPARMIGESLGMTVAWDASARKVTYSYGNDTMVLYVNSKTAYVNNSEYTLPFAPIITSDNRTLVHVRFAEALGCEFTWDATARRVDIYRN